METTTIKLALETKTQLDRMREHRSESYDDVIRKVLFIAKSAKSDPKLSKEAIEAIERAREQIRRGHYYTEAEARRRLGL